MDNFRHYQYVKRNLDQHNQFKNLPLASHDKSVLPENWSKAPDAQNSKPTTLTEYDDEYRVKQIDHYNQLILELKRNELRNNADKQSKAKERGKTANLLRSGLLDWPEGDNALPNDLGNQEVDKNLSKGEGEESDHQDEQEEEEFVLEKEDYTNIQSRLLAYQNNRNKKKLDPVYEGERLKRREERIKVVFS